MRPDPDRRWRDRGMLRRGTGHLARERSPRWPYLVGASLLCLVAASCGTRLSDGALASAKGALSGGGAASGNGGGLTGSFTTSPGSAGAGSGGSTPASAGTGSSAGGGTAGSASVAASGGASGSGSSGGACGGGTGGSTDIGVTSSTITVANIASISGVAPGLTQSAQQATEAWADYVNSQGGICGRNVKVIPMDDGNDSQQNYADAAQACNSAFAIVGSASGFDDGTASAAAKCGIPVVAAEVSTTAAGNVPNIFGASPGNARYWPLGAAEYLKAKYPDAIGKAAMIYLNVPATADQAKREMQAYQSVGFNYVYTASVSPTEPNYAPYVLQMQQKGVQYVTVYSDLSSAARLDQAMAQQNFQPQVVDWMAEMYSPDFPNQTQPASNGNLVLMATANYDEASGNPGMQTFLSWMNRVAPGFKHDIFAEFAWSAGMAFLKAAEAVGPHLTRTALLQQLAQIHNWDGGGVQPPMDFGNKVPSQCFSYTQIEGTAFKRLYPSSANQYDCSGGLYKF